jgi:hypothetical protein
MWRVEQERILTDLEAFLAQEAAEEMGFVPAFFEARFGPSPWTPPRPGSTVEPLELNLGDRTVRLTGFIDRIDLHPSGAARVIDYKSGGVYGEKDNLLRGGQSLQLPIYLLAADKMLADNGRPGQAQEAQYYYLTSKGRFRRVRFTREGLNDRRRDFDTILLTIAQNVEAGIFPQNPGRDGGNCQWCAYQPVCGHGRVRLIERKVGDPATSALRAMWEIE